jgi:hypothetical protein
MEMKALRALLVPALAAASLTLAPDAGAQTASHSARHSGATSGTHTGANHWSGTHRGAATHHWGGGRYWGGGYGYPYRHWHSTVGFYFGVPLFWPAYYYSPYYYDTYYPPRTIVYRDVERVMDEPPASVEVQRGPGSPTQGPLYMNYCESTKAYYPKVTACPEGWKFIAPTR